MGLVFLIDDGDGITGSRYGERLARVMEPTMSQYEPSGSYQQSQPYPPYPPYRPPPPWEGPPPTAVRYARNLIYLAIGMGLVRLVLLPLTYDLPELPETIDARIPDNVATAAFLIAAVFGALSTATIWFVVAIFIMQAAPWARVVLAILCGLDVTGLLWALLGSLASDDPLEAWLIVDVASALVILAATVLLWMPLSSRFFETSRYPS